MLKPKMVVALGGTAGRALYGRNVKVMSERGRVTNDPRGFRLLLTIHPSMILRLPSQAEKKQAFVEFVEDLRQSAPPPELG